MLHFYYEIRLTWAGGQVNLICYLDILTNLYFPLPSPLTGSVSPKRFILFANSLAADEPNPVIEIISDLENICSNPN